MMNDLVTFVSTLGLESHQIAALTAAWCRLPSDAQQEFVETFTAGPTPEACPSMQQILARHQR